MKQLLIRIVQAIGLVSNNDSDYASMDAASSVRKIRIYIVAKDSPAFPAIETVLQLITTEARVVDEVTPPKDPTLN
jgi:hypothetical protein